MKKKLLNIIFLSLLLTSCKKEEQIEYSFNAYVENKITSLNNHKKLDDDEEFISSLISTGLYSKSVDENNNLIYLNELAKEEPKVVKLNEIDTNLYSYLYKNIGNPSYNSIFEIKLNENAKFSNGNDIKADDYLSSLELLLNPLYNNDKSSIFIEEYPLINANKYFYQNKYYVESLYTLLNEDVNFTPSDGSYYLNITKTNPFISNLFSNNIKASLYTLIYQSTFSKTSNVALKGQRIIDATINFLVNAFFAYYDTIRTDNVKRIEHEDEIPSYLSFYYSNKEYYENNMSSFLQLVNIEDEDIINNVSSSMLENHPCINIVEFDNHTLYVRKEANNNVLSSNNSELYSYKKLIDDMNYFTSNLSSSSYSSPFKFLLYVNYKNNTDVSFDEVGIKKKDDYTLYFFFVDSLSIDEVKELFCYNFLVDTSLYKSLTLKNSVRKESEYQTGDISHYSSYGQYKIDEITNEKIILIKNEYYYDSDYSISNNYQSDKITIYFNLGDDEKTFLFMSGKLDYLKYNSSLTEYYSSSFLKSNYTTKSERLSINSNYDSLISREKDNKNKSILSNINFRKGIYLAINRNEYSTYLNLDARPLYTLYSNRYTSNPYTREIYRNSDYGMSVKNTMESVLSNDENKVNLSDNIYNYISSINYLFEGLKEEIQSTKISSLNKGDTISLDLLFKQDNDLNNKKYNYLKKLFNEIFESVNNKLIIEGIVNDNEKINLEINKVVSDDYESLISTGEYDLTIVTSTGNYLNPFSYMNYFASSSSSYCYEYNLKGKQNEEKIAIDLNDDNQISEDEIKTYDEYSYMMNNKLKEDSFSLITRNDNEYSSYLKIRNQRLKILSGLEFNILSRFETIPLINYTNSYFLSCKINSRENYSIINNYGSIKDYNFNYKDAMWDEYLKTLNYNLTDKYKG